MAVDPALAKALFLEASDLDSTEERAAYLDRECSEDAELRARVEALLAAHDGGGPIREPDTTGLSEHELATTQEMSRASVLRSAAPSESVTGEHRLNSTVPTVAGAPTARSPGGFSRDRVVAGRYTLVELLGEGGMGTVYRAEQSQPVKRQVALKLIKTGMDSRAVLARFDAERQALALMDHPNIARVYDGGATEANQPFFVMELVRGVPITEYCDQHRLGVLARLELFVTVCQAVQHAHQKGIIHRDLKPSNILVTEVDGRPTPKVIDFGVAKATESNLTDQSFADTGAIVGTPAYMSPEQADPSSTDIDTRTDVYALGVILYELLSGSPPIDAKQFKRGAIFEMLRMVREVDPPRPSTRVSTSQVLPAIAAGRGASPEHLMRALRGDLDWIVMKALEKDRTRRYETANGFAADIRRHLAHEPVVAAPPSRVYRVRKFVRKHKAGAIAASLVLLTLLAGIAGTTWGLIEARRQELEARRQERIARSETSEKEAARHAEAMRAEGERLAKQKALAAALAEKNAKETAEAAEAAGRKLLYTTDMRLAPFLWRDDRTTADQLRVLLAKHIPESKAAASTGVSAAPEKSDLRGFEWHYYQHLLQQSALVFSGHGESLVDAALTPEGPLVTLDQNGQVRRWDLSSQHEDEASRRDLPGAQVRVLSPDGRLAGLAGGDWFRVFDTATGREKFAVDSTNTYPRRLIFARDGERLVVLDTKLRWVSTASGQVIASLAQKFDRVGSLALSADGLTLAVVGHAASGQLASIFRLDPAAKTVTPLAKDFGLGGTLNASALTPDGGRIAVGAKLSGILAVFDAATGRVVAGHGSAHASPITAMAFAADRTMLATADAEGTIKIWEDAQKLSAKNTALVTLKGHQGAIGAVSFSSDSKWLVTASDDKTARVWDLEHAGAAIRPLEGPHNSGSFVVRCSPDGKLIAVSGGRSVRLWDAATGRLVRELPPLEKGSIFSVAFSPTESRLMAVGCGGEANVSHVALWDIDTQTELARLTGATDLPDFVMGPSNGPVGALEFSPDGKYLVAGFGSKAMLMTELKSPFPLMVWEVATRRPIRRLKGHTNYCVSLDFSRDGTLLASGSRDGTAIIWSTRTWNRSHTLQNPEKVSTSIGRAMVEGVAFSPDAKALALASRAGSVQLWDVATGTLLETLKGHSDAVLAVRFSPDGRTMVSGGSDQTVRLWNVQTRRELMQLDQGGVELGQAQSLTFSPDGQHLLATGGSNAFWSTTPIVWNDPDRAAEELRLLLNSNADFQSRIRMLSENLGLHEALAKLDANDERVQAALAATQANWHASRQAWLEATLAFDRFLAADPKTPEGWLRTPGLLRVATALVHQNRPRDAAVLLAGGAMRRTADGLPSAVDRVGIGVTTSTADGQVRVSKLLTASPASQTDLLPGDVILKVDNTELTRESLDKLKELLAGEAGTKVRLTVRHAGSDAPAVIELTRKRFVHDPATGDLLYPLREAVSQRLARAPGDAGWLELRAELAGQWSDATAQVADYTAAIDALAQQKAEAAAPDLKRLYSRRGNAYVALKRWQPAFDDYGRAVTDATTDEALLSNQALAQANANALNLPASFVRLGKQNEANGIHLVEFEAEGLTEPAEVEGQECRLVKTGSRGWGHAYLVLDKPSKWAELMDAHVEIEYWADGTGYVFMQADAPEDSYKRAAQDVQLDGLNGWKTAQFAIKGARFANSQNGGAGFRIRANTAGRFYLKRVSVRRLIPGEESVDPWVKLAGGHYDKKEWDLIDKLVKRHPASTAAIGDLFADVKQWQRAIDVYSKAITNQTTDADLLSKRARASEALKNWDAAAADWSRAAAGIPDGAKLLAGFARRLAAAGQVAFAKASFKAAEGLYERALLADPGNDVVAADLAQLLLDRPGAAETDWVVLKPAETKTESGAKLTIEDEGSILLEAASRTEPQTVRWQGGPQPVRAVRIETSTDPVAPGAGVPLFKEYRIVTPTGTAAPAGALRGRFVRLDLPGDNREYPRLASDLDKKTINLAELQVFQGHKNIALRKQAQQSSTIVGEDRLAPAGAVDGNTVGNDQGNPYAHTHIEDNPWWEVDLGSEQAIDRMVVWNRADISLYPRMNHFRIRVLNRARQVVFEQVIDKAPKPSTEIIPQAVVVETKSGPGGDNPPVIVRLPSGPLADVPLRYRVSAATQVADLGAKAIRQDLMKAADVETRLATAYAVCDRNEEALLHFNKALEQADGHEARKPILGLAAQFDPVISALAGRQPDDPQLQSALARGLAERAKVRLAEQQPAQAQAELERFRAVHARLRARYPQPQWTVLTPAEMKSQGGETLTVEPDGGIFVSGPNPNRAVYTLKPRTNLKTLTAIRLETIPDARLPGGGAGRFGNGNFHLAEFSAAIEPGQADARPIPIEFGSALADDRTDLTSGPDRSTDGNPQTRWDTSPRSKLPHWVIWSCKAPVPTRGGSLDITLDSGISNWGLHGLGRFRLSATSQTDALIRARLDLEFRDSELLDLSLALATAHAQQGHASAAVDSFHEALDLATDRAAKAVIVTEAAGMEGVLEKLAERAAGDAQFQVALAHHFAERGDARSARAARAKARAAFEARLAKESDNAALAGELADLLLLDTTDWTVLKPTEMKSNSGAVLTAREDQSILVSGKSTLKDAYSVDFRDVPEEFHAIRLEALRDGSLPGGGPGTQPGGLFVLSEFKAFGLDDNLASPLKPIPLRSAWATFEERPAQQSLDAVPGGGWSISGGAHQAQSAYFSVAGDTKIAVSRRLRILLDFAHTLANRSPATLGCFRLSVSADVDALEREKQRTAAANAGGPWTKLAAAYAVIGSNDEALQWFSVALERADGDETRKPIRALAARFDAVFAALNQRHPDDPQWQLARARELAERGHQHLVEKQPAQAQADLEQSRALFTRLRAQDPEPGWTVLTPVKMNTETGARLELQNDGSVFVHQVQPARNDTYSLVFQPGSKSITGLRLEVLADSRLPHGGPGWGADTGTFVLNELTLQAAPADRPDTARSITLRNASADFSQTADRTWDVRGAIDGDGTTGWAIFPEVNKDHTAVFELAEDVGGGRSARLTVQLIHRYAIPDRNLGRFRLSFTNDRAAFPASQIRMDLKDHEVADCHVALGKAYAQQGQTNEAAASFAEAAHLAADRAGKARVIAVAAPLEGVLEKLTARAAGDPQLQVELAHHFAATGNAPLADKARREARASFEEKLANEPENSVLAAGLADLLLETSAAPWTVLKPIEMTSAGGATLTPRDDGSILAGGTNPAEDVYTLVARPGLELITAICLEALPDPTLPQSGPGRNDKGNYHLNELRVFSGGQPCALTNISVVYDETQEFRKAIDGRIDASRGWSNYPRAGEQNAAIVATRLQRAPVDDLKIELVFSRAVWKQCNLGRFRLSVSGDPAIFAREQNRFAAMKLADPWARLAAAYHVSGNPGALEALRKLHPAAAAAMGDLFAAERNWEGAVTEYRKALSDYPADVNVSVKLAAAYTQMGHALNNKRQLDEAIACFRKAIELDPKSAVHQYPLGLVLRTKGQLDEAIACFRKTIELDPKHAPAHAGLGDLLLRKGKLDEAIASDRKAIELNPKYAPTHTHLGDALRGQGRLNEAIASYRKAIELDPKHAESQNNLGNALWDKGQRDLAIAAYRKAVELDPKYAGTLARTGDALRDKGQWDEAIAWYRKALEVDPKDAPTLGRLGNALRERGQWDEAIAAYRKAIELDPKYAWGYSGLGLALARKRQWDEAIAAYRKAMEVDPKFARPHSYIGEALREKGQLDDAIASYHKAIELEPMYFGARDGLGQALARNGQRDGAIASFRKAIELNPKDARVRALLGDLLKDTGQLDEAIASYGKAIELDPRLTPTRTRLAKAQRLAAARDKLPAFQDGRYTPVSNVERLDLAEWCHLQELHRTSARLYTEAFAADPKQAADLGAGHRYAAACSAALAAAGKGEDAATLDDLERARLRKQALDWLRADLALRAKQVDSRTPADRATALTAMNQWQQDPRLAGIRNPDALARLPEADRNQCEALWADVQAILDRAQEKAP